MKGIYTKNDDANPITGPDDSKLLFLESLKTYIDIWHASCSSGKLTNETYIAFTHTLNTVVELCKYIFDKYNWSYILTSKLQTDGLESRFGAYRRLSGCTYNVSVEQILESERKLKVLGLLKLKSTKLGEFTLRHFAVKVNSNIKGKINENLDKLEPALEELAYVPITNEDLKVLFCIASYTSYKVLEKLRKIRKCSQCAEMLQSENEILLQFESWELLSYFNQINRGGLKCPSSIMISLCYDIYKLFRVLISSTYEADFLKLENQRDAVMTLGIELSENSISNLEDVCKSGILLKTVVKKCVKILSNIFINNYVKVLNDKNISKELAKKLENQKRKRSELPNQDAGLGTKMTKRKEMKLNSK